MFKVPNKYRVKDGPFASVDSLGNYGAFMIPFGRVKLMCIASAGEDMGPEYHWEHVSVRVHGISRCPTWEEMCRVKDLFWDEEDTVVQFHPAKSEYINMHPHVLHLWRNMTNSIKTPPKILIGL